MNEIWKPVVGYEGLYEASSLGRIKSLDRYVKCPLNKKRLIMGVVLSPAISIKGYYMVSLSRLGKSNSRTIHRIIAKAFISNYENKPCINHIDENKLNNKQSNLEWCTHSENNNHGTRLKRISLANKGKYRRPVLSYDLDMNFIKEYKGARETLGDGFSETSVIKCASGVTKKHKNRVWKYKEDINDLLGVRE